MDSISAFIVPAGVGGESAEDVGDPAEMLTPCGLRAVPHLGMSAPIQRQDLTQFPICKLLKRKHTIPGNVTQSIEGLLNIYKALGSISSTL